jgi:hypothetical protein
MKKIILIASLLTLSGCSTINKIHENEAFESVVKLAAFDLNCDKEDITLITLDSRCSIFGCVPQQVGASGCNHKVRYKNVPGLGWMANTSSK